ncbi:MAG: Na(+)/H(+) antiporter subunit B [Thermoguttaceae bacterium]
MENAPTNSLLLFLLIAAFFAVHFRDHLSAVLSLSVFSTGMSVVFAVYRAPDVALAEAVVGAGLGTALFLIAVSKTRGNGRPPNA